VRRLLDETEVNNKVFFPVGLYKSEDIFQVRFPEAYRYCLYSEEKKRVYGFFQKDVRFVPNKAFFLSAFEYAVERWGKDRISYHYTYDKSKTTFSFCVCIHDESLSLNVLGSEPLFPVIRLINNYDKTAKKYLSITYGCRIRDPQVLYGMEMEIAPSFHKEGTLKKETLEEVMNMVDRQPEMTSVGILKGLWEKPIPPMEIRDAYRKLIRMREVTTYNIKNLLERAERTCYSLLDHHGATYSSYGLVYLACNLELEQQGYKNGVVYKKKLDHAIFHSITQMAEL
jgi:hypothetical protein